MGTNPPTMTMRRSIFIAVVMLLLAFADAGNGSQDRLMCTERKALKGKAKIVTVAGHEGDCDGVCVSSKCDAHGVGKEKQGCLKSGTVLTPPPRCQDNGGKMPCLVCPPVTETCQAGEDPMDRSTRKAERQEEKAERKEERQEEKQQKKAERQAARAARRKLLSRDQMFWYSWCPWCG